MANWYEWKTIEDFNTWHDAICKSLGYPLTPVNQLTGEPDESAQKVVAYTNPVIFENAVIALVREEESAGLVETDLRPPAPEIS